MLPGFRILIVSIVLGAECSFYVKSIAIYAPQFVGYNNSVIATVRIYSTPLELVRIFFVFMIMYSGGFWALNLRMGEE